jgi:hypothetical protein
MMLSEIAAIAEEAAAKVKESISPDYLTALEAVDVHLFEGEDEKFYVLTWRATWKDKGQNTFQVVYPGAYLRKQGAEYVLGRTINRLLRGVFEVEREEIDEEPYPWEVKSRDDL